MAVDKYRCVLAFTLVTICLSSGRVYCAYDRLVASEVGVIQVESDNVVDILYVPDTYRKFAGDGKDPAWVDAYDTLTTMGFHMRPVQGGAIDSPSTVIPTDLGDIQVDSDPSLYKFDLHSKYDIPTIWPYCESLESCLVYTQVEEVDPVKAITLALPANVGAIDFYIDAAIDCVNTTKARLVCTVTVNDDSGQELKVREPLYSICDKADVGKYFGFFSNLKGGQLTKVEVKCTTPYARVLGLVRIAKSKKK